MSEIDELRTSNRELVEAVRSLIDVFHLDGDSFSRYGYHGESVVMKAKALLQKEKA